MSIAAMGQASTLKTAEQLQESPNPAGGADIQRGDGAAITNVPSGTLDSLMLWIPTETVGAYIAAQAIVGTPQIPAGGKLCDASFRAQWILIAAGVLLTLLGIAAAKKIKSDGAKPTVAFKLPTFELGAGTVAFLLWALALPQSPMFAWCSWDEKYGALAVIFGTPVITVVGKLLGQDPVRTST